MAKSFYGIAVSILLLLAAAFCEYYFVDRTLEEFYGHAEVVYRKATEENANEEDGKTLLAIWEEKKRKLHILIPHNDIAKIDDYLSAAIGAMVKKDYPRAVENLRIVLVTTKNLPQTYRPNVENVF